MPLLSTFVFQVLILLASFTSAHTLNNLGPLEKWALRDREDPAAPLTLNTLLSGKLHIGWVLFCAFALFNRRSGPTDFIPITQVGKNDPKMYVSQQPRELEPRQIDSS